MTFDPTSAQPEGAFDPTSATPDAGGPDTRTVLRTSVPVKPDDASEAVRLAKRYPQPADVLLRNLQDAKLQAAVDDADARLRTSPKLAEHMRNNPWTAKQAHDDIPALTQVADFIGKLGRSAEAGVYMANRGVGGVLRAGTELVAPLLDVLEADPSDPRNAGDWRVAMGGNPLRRFAEGLGMNAQGSADAAAAVRPVGGNWFTSGVFSGMESLSQNLLTLPIAMANPAAGLGAMGGMTGGNAYEDARAKGLPMEQALPFAASQAAIEIATEKLPLGKLLGDVKAGAPFFQTLWHQIKHEVPGEQVATILQDLNEWAILNPEKPFSDYLAERPSAAAQTLVATIVGAGGNVTVAKAIEATATRVLNDGADMQRAGAYAQALEQTLKAAEASALRERNPEAFRSLMAELSDNGTVYVDAEVLNQMPASVLQQMQGVADELPAALATGGTVGVKLADAMTLLAGTPQAELFMQHARVQPNAPSAFEAEQAGKKAGEFLKQEAERVLADAQDQEAARADSEAVKQNLLDQLNAAGRHSLAVNEGLATWAGAFYTTMAARTGMTAQEFYQRFPLRILAEASQGGQAVMDQPGTPAFDNWFGDSKVVDAEGKPLVLHHGTPAKGLRVFDASKIGTNGRAEGAGFYFTTDRKTAEGYGQRGETLDVHLAIKKPLHYDAKPFSQTQVRKLLSEVAKVEAADTGTDWRDGFLSNYADTYSATLDAAVREAAKAFDGEESALDQVSGIVGSGVNADTVNTALTKALGYDGYFSKGFSGEGAGGGDIWVAMRSEQVKSATGNSGVYDPKNPDIYNQSAYHGTPHRGIEQFSTDKIGTGEGAQAYGWGLYFASKREIAEWYRETTTGDGFLVADRKVFDPSSLQHMNVRGIARRGDLDAAIDKAKSIAESDSPVAAMAAHDLAVLEDVKARGGISKNPGQLYEVEIPDDEHMLLWDKPLSEQPAAVREVALELAADVYADEPRYNPDYTRGMELYRDYSRKFGALGGDKAASEALAATGIKGIKYLDGTSRSAGDGSFNYVVFSGDDVQIKQQFYQRTANTGPRGTFNPRTLELVLSPTADLSTFFHETGHFFLEVMSDLASQPGAPAQVVDDMNKILAWFGVPDVATWRSMTLDQQRPYHERWAESIEQYVMEGKAPSAELQGPMRRFAAWLKSVYGSIKQFLAMRGVATSGPVLGQMPAPEGFKTKVVGKDGKPLALYHGTVGDVQKFDPARSGSKSKTGAPEGTFFFTDKPDVASSYTVAWQGDFSSTSHPDANVMQVYVALQKPLKVSAKGESWRDIEYKGQFYDINELAALAKQGGKYDGLIVTNVRDKGVGAVDSKTATTVVAFDPKQIVSAISGEVLGQGDQPTPSNIQLNDDIRRVMDRMLATDEQIAQANEMAGLSPDEDADAQAAERLRKRSMADLKWAVAARDKVIAKLRKQARAIEKDIREQVTVEVDAAPEMRAKAALAKLRKESNLNDATQAATADAFGYKSVDEMLQAIDAYGPRKDAIDSITQRRMLEEHGDLVDEDAIKQAANEAVHNEARARSLASELRTQREMLGARTDTGEVNAAGAKITTNTLVEAAKQFGAQVVGRTSLVDLKNRAWQHTAAERRAAKRWAEATAAGKTEEAVKAKQDQLLNNAAAKAALEARTEAQKILDFFKRVAKGNTEDVVEKGRDADVVNAARAVLAAYGVQTPTTKTADTYLDLVAKHDPETYDTIKPMVEGALRNAQPLDALTYDQLAELRDDIDAMWHLAKRMRQMEVAGDLIDIQEAADDLHARMVEKGIPDTVPGEAGAVTKAQERARWLQFARALLRRVEQWTESMDGKTGGPFSRFVFQPIKQAADAYRTDRSAYRKKFQALVDSVAPALKPGLIEAPELGYTFGMGHNGIGHAELLHAILHTGNDSNKRKLLLGRQWATETAEGVLDTTQWDMFINRLIATGVLTKAHYDFAQGVWDLLEETKPLAQKAHRDVFGRYFDEVTANEFITPFGTYRGGYVPAQADPLLVHEAELHALANIENENMAYSFPTTSKGFTKSRVEYNRPLKLDLRTIPQHLDKVLLFSHMEPAVRGVTRLLRQKGVSQGLNRIDPAAYSGMLLPWLNRSARQQVETPVMGDGRVSRVLSTLRSRAGAALMFANVSNAVQQVTGLSNALVLVKGSHLMNGVAQMIAHPKQTRAAVAAASPYMAERMDNEVAAMNDAMHEILLNPSLYEKAQAWAMRHSYFLQSAIDNAIGPMVWTGAYNHALAEGMADKDAAAFADGVIRKTQGSTMPEDVSRIETGPAYARVFTQFIGYFNTMANTNGTALAQIAGEMGLKRGAGKALGVVFYGMLAPIWVAEAIAQAFKGGPDDPEGDGYLDDWLAAVFGMGTIKGMLAQVPFVAQLGQVAVNRFNKNPADDRFSLSPAVSLLESASAVPYDVYKAITDEVNTQRLVRDSAALVSVATGLPASAIARPLGYAAGVSQGKIDPTGPGDLARGLVTGVASPESKQR